MPGLDCGVFRRVRRLPRPDRGAVPLVRRLWQADCGVVLLVGALPPFDYGVLRRVGSVRHLDCGVFRRVGSLLNPDCGAVPRVGSLPSLSRGVLRLVRSFMWGDGLPAALPPGESAWRKGSHAACDGEAIACQRAGGWLASDRFVHNKLWANLIRPQFIVTKQRSAKSHIYDKTNCWCFILLFGCCVVSLALCLCSLVSGWSTRKLEFGAVRPPT